MPAIRGPSVAEPLWNWGGKRWTSASVCLAASSQSSVCMQCMTVCVQMHACEHLCGGAACFFFTICSHWCISSSALISSPQNYFQICLFLPWVYCVFVGFRYPPSSRQTSHEEGKEWLRSHSTGGLQDTGSQSPLSPPGASCTTSGKYHYSNLRKSVGITIIIAHLEYIAEL